MNVFLNTLYITSPEAYLHLEGDTICVKIDHSKKLQVPIHHLGALVLFDHVMLSPALLARCADDGRTIVWLDRSGHFKVRLEGPVNGNILLRQSQFRSADNSKQTLAIASAILAGKLRNSRQVLMRGARESSDDNNKQQLVQTCRLIAGQIKKLPLAESLDTLRGLEGDSARLYFAALPLLMRGNAKENFPFTMRNRRPPRDRFNALISFLYALVLNDCRSALESTGLDPQLGYLHAVRPGRPALALDLLEEFRAPLADRLALTLINRAQLQPNDFIEREGGAVLLSDAGRKTVITAYQDRKQETLQHPLLETATPIGLLPHLQARLLARYLRGDVETYLPYLHK